jgi:hypothetical protein
MVLAAPRPYSSGQFSSGNRDLSDVAAVNRVVEKKELFILETTTPRGRRPLDHNTLGWEILSSFSAVEVSAGLVRA